ncbi:MAG: (deoxy)nucleoside triphosphate pyrophosphohydrolase [Erysipelotrichaceae bacterium]|nr:(deoxy)nucleoside triphosphate pyrophosphohydrolase [Erysipelotrichaceae bacterium]
MIKVVAALIRKDDKYLIARRSTGSPEVFGKWEFPGGKVKPDESEEEAIVREIKEEFDMDVRALRYLTNNICVYPSKTIDLRLYECEYISGDFHLHDHFESRYVSKDEILDYDLCPADVPLAEFVSRL